MLNIKDSYENSMIYLLYMKLVYIENPQNYEIKVSAGPQSLKIL